MRFDLCRSHSLQVEACGLTLAHQFPWAASSYVAIGLALRRRLLLDPASPSTAPKRRQIIRVGADGDARRSELLSTRPTGCLFVGSLTAVQECKGRS